MSQGGQFQFSEYGVVSCRNNSEVFNAITKVLKKFLSYRVRVKECESSLAKSWSQIQNDSPILTALASVTKF